MLAGGAPLAEAGAPCDPDELVRLELPRPRIEDGVLVAHAVYVDRFGNVQLDVEHEDLAATGLKLGREIVIQTPAGDPRSAQFARTFAEVDAGRVLLYEDGYRRLAVAVSHGDAAELLGIAVDDELRVLPR